MLLIDLNQVLIANLMQQIGSNPKVKLEEDLIRHMVLNSLRSYISQFKQKYGEIVIACDSKNYWRREVFPLYKANRKKDREKSKFDWNLIFDTLNKIRGELKEYFPYKVIEVDGAEADDIIGVLTKLKAPHEDVLILSSDKDFVQLQRHGKSVHQYLTSSKSFCYIQDPYAYMKEHIIRGDRGDGIPNFLSADNVFALGERQKVISKKNLLNWVNMPPEDFCTNDNMMRGYKRNQMLIDLDFIPEKIEKQIVEAYENAKVGNRQLLLNYFIEKKLKNLLSEIQDF